jgi:phosphatidylserine/phosphatidylglycerophosphate/cardiolipin synthase-like enzyme
MSVLFGFLLIAAMVLLIIGLIKPQKVVFWAKNKTKKMALLGYGCALVVIIVLGCVTAPNQTQTTMASASKPVTSSAKVASSSKPEAVSSKSSPSKPETISSTPSPKNIQTSSQQSQTQQSAGISVQYYFPRGGQNPEPVLIGLINSAKSSLDIAIYEFTDKNISDAVINAKKRGVTVRVISDKECSSESYQKEVLNALLSAGIPVKINTHSGLMHLKVSIIDNSIATTGSYNYTIAAMDENDEVFVVLNDVKVAQDFDTQFVRMWNDTKDFTNY